MLTVATLIQNSKIAGLGCFAMEDIPAETVVWYVQEPVDRITKSLPYIRWERQHGYLSTTEPGRFVLPRDNAAYMNFAEDPNLKEGGLFNGEPVLMAARFIAKGEELTVPFNSDADCEWKLLS